MSQRTRVPTTGAAPEPPADSHEPVRRPARSRKPASRQSASATPGTLDPAALARALRAVATELERDPALAQRLSATMRDLLAPSESESETSTTPPARAKKAGGPKDGASPPRTGRSFQPRVIEGASPDLGPGIPDPFALRERLGEAGLRAALDGLRLGSLRAIVREHKLDPDGAGLRTNDTEKLRTLIMEHTAVAHE